MVIAPNVLALIRCPMTGTPVRHATPALVDQANEMIRAGKLENQMGQTVREPLDDALTNEGEEWLLPIRGDVISLVKESLISVADLGLQARQGKT
jgi:hypothetical protein